LKLIFAKYGIRVTTHKKASKITIINSNNF